MGKLSEQEIGEEIKAPIQNFCEEYLNSELKEYVLKLLDTVKRSRKLSISRGKKEIWAAAIIYVIARLNYLFDNVNEHFITVDIICEYFNTKKSTTGNKATQIEKACRISIGDKRFCGDEISSMFEFVETPEGFLIPKTMLSGGKNLRSNENIEKRRQKREQKIREQKERENEKRKKIAEEKKRAMYKDQLNLFDDL